MGQGRVGGCRTGVFPPHLYAVLQNPCTAMQPNHKSTETHLPHPPVPSGTAAPTPEGAEGPGPLPQTLRLPCIVPNMPTYVENGLLYAPLGWMSICPCLESDASGVCHASREPGWGMMGPHVGGLQVAECGGRLTVKKMLHQPCMPRAPWLVRMEMVCWCPGSVEGFEH